MFALFFVHSEQKTFNSRGEGRGKWQGTGNFDVLESTVHYVCDNDGSVDEVVFFYDGVDDDYSDFADSYYYDDDDDGGDNDSNDDGGGNDVNDGDSASTVGGDDDDDDDD